jgi:hypothetical protein
MRHFAWALLAGAAFAPAQEKYVGPVPPKKDVPYLLHANKLVELDTGTAQPGERKDNTLYTVSGAGAQARTPMAEPVFLLDSAKIAADKLSLWRMTPKGGLRELEIPKKPKRDSPRPMRVNATRLSGNLYKVEAQEFLENGEYCLSPDGSNEAFCFAVY